MDKSIKQQIEDLIREYQIVEKGLQKEDGGELVGFSKSRTTSSDEGCPESEVYWKKQQIEH
jgi:hypothetical protein